MNARQAPWVLDMVWRDVCFAHWRADAQKLARALPPGITLDRYAGEAWLSVVPFRMTGVHARCTPVLPGFADVPEINLRTYVRVGETRGIWFFSLDASRPLVVNAARITTALPYYHAQIATREDAAGIDYVSERTHRGVTAGRFAAHYAAPSTASTIVNGSLEAFLHERYRFYTQRGARLVSGEVRHAPWTLAPTQLDIRENTLGDIIAHPLVGQPDYAFFARMARVRACAVHEVRVTDR